MIGIPRIAPAFTMLGKGTCLVDLQFDTDYDTIKSETGTKLIVKDD